MTSWCTDAKEVNAEIDGLPGSGLWANTFLCVAALAGWAFFVQMCLLSIAGGPAPDGVRFIARAEQVFSEGVIAAWRRQGSEPVFPTIVAVVHWVRSQLSLGQADWAVSVQIAAAAGVVLAVLFVYFLSLELVGPTFATTSALLFSLLPEMARLGADGIADAWSIALASGAIYLFLRSWGGIFAERTPFDTKNKDSLRGWVRARTGISSSGGDDAAAEITSPKPGWILKAKFRWATFLPGGELFVSGLMAATAAMCHRATLTFAAFGILALGGCLLVAFVKIVTHLRVKIVTHLRVIARTQVGKKSGDWYAPCNSVIFAGSQEPNGSPFGISVVGGGERIGFAALRWPFFALALFTGGFFTAYAIYWSLLQPANAEELIASMVEDGIAKAPYPTCPPEHERASAGTHEPAPYPSSGLPLEDSLKPEGKDGVATLDGELDKELYFLRESFILREFSANDLRPQWLGRLKLVGQELADAFGYLLGVPALFGAIALWPRRGAKDLLAWGYAIFHTGVCLWWTLQHGYISARHFGPVVVLGAAPAAWCLRQVGSGLGAWGGPAVVAAMGCLLFGDALSNPPNVTAVADRQAAIWLRDHTPSAWVADCLGYTGLWSGRYTIAVDDLWLYLHSGKIAAIVLSREELLTNSWRGELLRTLLATAGEEVASFSTEECEQIHGGRILGVVSAWLFCREHFFRKPPVREVVIFRWDNSRWQRGKKEAIAQLRQKVAQHNGLVLLAPPLDTLVAGFHQEEAGQAATAASVGFQRR